MEWRDVIPLGFVLFCFCFVLQIRKRMVFPLFVETPMGVGGSREYIRQIN